MTEGDDIVKELSILRAECSPAYLLTQHNHETLDPIQRAFYLIQRCSSLINQSNTLVDEKMLAIRRCLEDFTGKMLNLCEDLNEAEILLSRDDGLLNFRGTETTLPRIRVAIQCREQNLGEIKFSFNYITFWEISGVIVKFRDLPSRLALQLKNHCFLIHDHSQLLARKFFTNDKDFAKAKGKTYFLRVILQLIVTPLFCVCYSLRKIGIRVNCGRARGTLDSWYNYLKTPGW